MATRLSFRLQRCESSVLLEHYCYKHVADWVCQFYDMQPNVDCLTRARRLTTDIIGAYRLFETDYNTSISACRVGKYSRNPPEVGLELDNECKLVLEDKNFPRRYQRWSISGRRTSMICWGTWLHVSVLVTCYGVAGPWGSSGDCQGSWVGLTAVVRACCCHCGTSTARRRSHRRPPSPMSHARPRQGGAAVGHWRCAVPPGC